MSDLTFNSRDDLIDTLKSIQYQLYDCADLDQRLTHAPHRSDYYVDLINRVETLIDAERALNLRNKIVGR
jgi:uncharacterized protein (DUF2461 family)